MDRNNGNVIAVAVVVAVATVVVVDVASAVVVDRDSVHCCSCSCCFIMLLSCYHVSVAAVTGVSNARAYCCNFNWFDVEPF